MNQVRSAGKKYAGMLAGGLTLVLVLIFSGVPGFVESVYSHGIFSAVRWFFNLLGWFSPVSLSLILLLGLMLGIGRSLVLWHKRRRSNVRQATSWRSSILILGRKVLNRVGVILCLFYFLWGFNYLRQPLITQMELEAEAPELIDLCEMTAAIAEEAAMFRNLIPGLDTAHTLDPGHLPEDQQAQIQIAFQKASLPTGLPDLARKVRIRMVGPGGWMLRLNVAGIYNPFVGEGHVSTALFPTQVPFTIAHEMAHGMGYGDEGTCNFLGALGCSFAGDPAIQYSGAFSRFRYFANELYRRSPGHYLAIADNLDPGLRRDLVATRENSRQYSGQLRRVGTQLNNAYLRSQGVEGGVESYNRVVLLWMAYQKESGSEPR